VDISHQNLTVFKVGLLARLVELKAGVSIATVLMHPWKFWLCWLWQRIMSGFEDFKNIW